MTPQPMFKGAIVGFGEVARYGHWPAYQSNPDLTIVAVVDRTAERRRLAEALAPGIQTFDSVQDLIGSTTVDFFDVCTPPAFHAEPMLIALARGSHVLCEKPFLLDPVVFEIVRRRAHDARVAAVPVHNWKYAPIIRAATEQLQSGAIGSLRRVEIETLRLRASPTAVGSPNWRRDPAIAGGGILMDHGWHAVYLALHWFGEPAVSVHGALNRPSEAAVEDEASVTIAFAAGEASIRLTWNADVRRNTARLVGDRGEILIDDDTLHVRAAASRRIPFAQALSSGSHHDAWFAAMLPDVARSFQNPCLAAPALDEAAACLTIIRQVYQG
jgi:predicted dehydrogenase